MRATHSNRSSSRRDSRRSLGLQKLESRNLLTALPLGATPQDTGEFLLGRVVVTPVLFESNGEIDPQTQNWSSNEVDATLAKITEGVNWWSDTLDALNTVHTLDFVVDPSFAKNADTGELTTVPTPYEPIDRESNFFSTYVGDFLTDEGYGDAGQIENAIRLFNNDQRIRYDADWAFTVFIVDSSNDSDGQFASGGDFGSAFAFAGGQFMIAPSTRPASTIAHEMGHIFWARDEYPGAGHYTDRRGYYNAQNLNAFAGNPTGIQEPSIMRGGSPLQQAYEGNFSPASTLALVGWRDSDGDGIFDVADVPLRLDAVGSFDATTSTYRLTGSASAQTLANLNSSGLQSDITLNRVSEIQYSLDQGPWTAAVSPDAQVTDVDISVSIPSSFESIRWRAIDQSVGVVSNIVAGTNTTPALSESSLRGFAFLDENENGVRETNESLLSSTHVSITDASGQPLKSGSIAASDFGDQEINGPVDGATIAADGELLTPEIASFEVAELGDARAFQAFNLQRSRYDYRWSDDDALVANFDSEVGQVEVDIVGLDRGSYGRIEAFDASGNSVGRVTSELIADQQSETLRITDAAARIASVRITGHARTDVAITAIRFGFDSQTTTDASGTWQLPNLPDGTYRLTLQPQMLVHQFDTAIFDVQVSAGGTDVISSSAQRGPNPRHNSELAVDVNGDGTLEASDAFIVINDLNLNQSRLLGHGDATGPMIDVNDDGSVTPLDALIVVNALSRGSLGQPEAESTENLVAAERGSTPLIQPGLAREFAHGAEANASSNRASGNWARTDAALADWTNDDTQSPIWTDFLGSSDWSDRTNPADHETDVADPSGESADRKTVQATNSDVARGVISSDLAQFDEKLGHSSPVKST